MELNSKNIEIYIDAVNVFKQLYMHTCDYRCEKDMINFMICLSQLIYLYNNEKLYDCKMFIDETKCFKLEIFNLFNLPLVLTGYRKPGFDLQEKYIKDDDFKIETKINLYLLQLYIDIFKKFGAYSYQELIFYIKDMNIYKEGSKLNRYLSNKSVYRLIFSKEIDEELLRKVNISNNFIEEFIREYDFSLIRAKIKLKDIEDVKESKIKKFINR